jgi:inosose dehydratase
MPIRIATAPVSWGILEFAGQSSQPPWEAVLDEMAAAGYTGTELGPYGYLPTEPEALRAALAARGLQLLSAFVPVRLAEPSSHAAGTETARRVGALLAACGCRHIVLSDDNAADPNRLKRAGRITPADGLDDESWRTLAEGVNTIARKMKEAFGLETVFHHHCAGFVETPDEVARLLELTDPGTVGLCLDTGHYVYGGGDPVECIYRHGARVRYLHFKDADPGVMARARTEGWDYFQAVAAGVFCELGRGCVNFADVIAAMNELNYDGWAVVEQDIVAGMGTPLESARRNRAYLRGSGL